MKGMRIMKNKIIALVLTFAMATSLVACGSKDDERTRQRTAATEESTTDVSTSIVDPVDVPVSGVSEDLIKDKNYLILGDNIYFLNDDGVDLQYCYKELLYNMYENGASLADVTDTKLIIECSDYDANVTTLYYFDAYTGDQGEIGKVDGNPEVVAYENKVFANVGVYIDNGQYTYTTTCFEKMMMVRFHQRKYFQI